LASQPNDVNLQQLDHDDSATIPLLLLYFRSLAICSSKIFTLILRLQAFSARPVVQFILIMTESYFLCSMVERYLTFG